MTTRIAAAAAALVLGMATISSAVAAPRSAAPSSTWTGYLATGADSIGISTPVAPLARPYDRSPVGCPMSSAAEGNANQQNFPVKQYGQTTGGNRC